MFSLALVAADLPGNHSLFNGVGIIHAEVLARQIFSLGPRLSRLMRMFISSGRMVDYSSYGKFSPGKRPSQELVREVPLFPECQAGRGQPCARRWRLYTVAVQLTHLWHHMVALLTTQRGGCWGAAPSAFPPSQLVPFFRPHPLPLHRVDVNLPAGEP